MFTTFHASLSWSDAKTDKLVKQAKQQISCAELKFRPKNSNFKHEFTSWNFHLGSWRNIFWSKMRSLSWVLDENVRRNPESVSWSHGSSMNGKVFEVWEKYALSWEREVKWVKIFFLELGKFFSLEKFGWNEKLANFMLDPLSSQKN